MEQTGYIMPQAVDIEKAILGALILEPDAINKIKTITKLEHFYKPSHEKLYEIILYLVDISNSVDMLTITQEARNKGVIDAIGGVGYIAELINTIASAGHIESHARIVRQKYFERESILLSNEAARKIKSGEDAYETSKWLTEQLDNLFILEDGEGQSFKDIIADTNIDIKAKMEGIDMDRKYTNSPFDKVFDFSPDECIWLAARAKESKTKSLIYIMSLLLKENHEDIAVKWFSFEDPTKKIIRHWHSIFSNIPIDKMEGKLKDQKITNDELETIITNSKEFENYDISLFYGSAKMEKVTTDSLNFIRKRKHKHNFIIIDNFNILVSGITFGSQTEKETIIADAIHNLHLKANEQGYKSTLIVLDHLSKNVFKDGLKTAYRAKEQDLRGSGRKIDILTSLTLVNRTQRSPDLIDEYAHLPDKTLADGNEWSMTDILNKMSIYEVITSRNGGCESGVPVRFIADLNTMSFRSWEEMKNPPNHIEQPSIPSSLLDTEVEEVKDEWDDAPF